MESFQVDEHLTDSLALTMTSHQVPIIRGVAALVMGVLQPPRWEEQLRSLATDIRQPDEVRSYAIRGLGLSQTASGIEHVVQAGNSHYIDTWPVVQATLKAVTRPEAMPGLAAAAASGRWWIREAVATSIGRIGTDEAMALLTQLAQDGDSAVRKAAVNGLLLASRSDAVPLLCHLATDNDHEVRTRAIEVLWTHYPDLAVTPLIGAAKDPGHPARAEIVELLGRVDRPDVEQALRALAADPDRVIRDAVERGRAAREIAEHRHPAKAWIRHPLTVLAHGLKEWLQWDGLRRMWDEERLAGTPGNQIPSRLMSRIGLDAELTRRFRSAVRMYLATFMLCMLLLTALTLFLARACLWLSHVLLDHWLVISVLVALGGITLLPLIRDLNNTKGGALILTLLKVTSAAVVIVATVGLLTYTWWIWLLLVFAAGAVAAWWSWRRTRQAGRRVRDVMSQVRQQPEAAAGNDELAPPVEPSSAVQEDHPA
jgi:HEAT repeat protein